MKKPELLLPAGNLDKLKIAFLYGADAVYGGGEMFSLRASAGNFTFQELAEGASYAHKRGKKIYLTANIIPHNDEIGKYPKFLKKVVKAGIDGVIVSDFGIFSMTRELFPDLDIHISTQANNVNWMSCQKWFEMGAKRVILARELSLTEISEIREKIPNNAELEAFVHGAMCISYSGRCLLSNYLAGRDANRGDCAQPCRWKYSLVEETRPGEYMNVLEDSAGTYIFNSKDLCMIRHIPELVAAGISSFKIEGRMKSEYYVATTAKIYRTAIDKYFDDPDSYTFDESWLSELQKISHRGYTTGFYFGKPDKNSQNYETSSYIRNYDLIGIVESYDPKLKQAKILQKNRFFVGDEVEVFPPVGKFFTQKIEKIVNEAGENLDVANRPHDVVTINMDQPVQPGTMLRKKVEDN